MRRLPSVGLDGVWHASSRTPARRTLRELFALYDQWVWIFGYGSLIFRPAFPYQRREPATIRGYVRRFWQSSTDHRGTQEAPGRVVTLIPQAQGLCVGVAFELASGDIDEVMVALDYREKGGYRRIELDAELRTGGTVRAVAYYGDSTNPHYVGEASVAEIASIARVAVGPSGPNRDYVAKLRGALDEMGVTDSHVRDLADLVERRE